ncbi:MAG: FtsX-like permease family protein, partial [Bacteroidales bacterium]|nr:FtsX-like permease family protein [Bacteroidales bacterium]
ERGDYAKFLAQPITDIHLKSNLLWEFEPNGNVTYVNFFSIIAIFILVIAVINYINLSTARSAGRAKEVGIRKALGSSRGLLVRQFLAESILMSLLAMFFAFLTIYIFMPSFKNLVGKAWLLNPISENPEILIPLLLVAILIGVVAGIYPSFVLSSYSPVSSIHGKLSRISGKPGIRNGLVVFQFFMSVVLLIMTIFVQKQMDFIQNKDLGYNNEQVVVVKTYGQLNNNLQLLKEKLKENPSILSMSASSSLPGTQFTNIGMALEGTNSNHGRNLFLADEDFLETMKIRIEKGRYFDVNFPTDSQAVVINQTMANNLNVDNLLEKRMMIWAGGQDDQPFPIIGIVRDFHYESFHEPVKPMVIVKLYGTCPWLDAYFSIRITDQKITETISFIQATWDEVMPGTPFDYSFLDSIYDAQYKNEQRTGHVFFLFTLFMIFVACLGLLGMASFTVERRNMEIALRKIMGATIKRIILLLTSDLLRWAILATVLAWPVSYLLMDYWLAQFSYRTDISIWPFLFATLIILLITILTILFHVFKASLKNPVNSLRSE